eukprot:CAMPEP_0172875538 /NCGR_PEP_ID=MMETSP1075-20121228/101947_1 /TAXON_ID=2916 /ORGANISM="Ceratium fusus, Strain PA161109" /LENGTH=81 /DNA_ID=CAMNT_0013726631 /DNA_START=19 /DNA_END=262 /DNA_ORIENTATION=+
MSLFAAKFAPTQLPSTSKLLTSFTSVPEGCVPQVSAVNVDTFAYRCSSSVNSAHLLSHAPPSNHEASSHASLLQPSSSTAL